MISRKDFLLGAGALIAGVSLGTPVLAKSIKKKVVKLKNLKPLEPIMFNYPDENSPAVLIDMGEPVYMGIGPKKSIVAFSSLCQHMGCPVNFDKEENLLVCPCHLSMYDPAKGGMCVEGPAINRLPMIALKEERGNIYAVGFLYGLVYGKAKNF